MVWVFHLMLFLGCGCLIGNRIFCQHTLVFRLSAGLVFGLLGAMWSPVPFAFRYGFSPLAHYLGWGLMVPVTLVIVGLYREKRGEEKEAVSSGHLGRWEMISVLHLTLFICFLFTNHFFQAADGTYFTRGNLFGDLPFHLGMITSLTEQGFFPPEYTFFQGAHLGYPFLTNLFSASLNLFGLSLRWAVLIPSYLMTFLLVFWFFQFSHLILKKRFPVLLSSLLFFANGGLGAFYLLDKAWIEPEQLRNLFRGLTFSPTNWFENNIIWSNVICDLLLPQRTTLAGWAVLFFILFLLYRALTLKSMKDFFLAGLTGGLLPMVHTHSFFALSIISLTWFILSFQGEADKKRLLIKWLAYGMPLLMLAVPQLWQWTLSQAGHGGFFRFLPGWANQGDIWPWFWLKNAGVVFVLIFPALLYRDRTMNRWYCPAIIIFVLAELFAFQPWAWDNTKLFFIWYLFSVILVSGYLVRLHEQLSGFPTRNLLIGILVFFAVFSGGLSLLREAVLPPHQLFSRDQVALAEYLKKHTLQDGLFLTAGHHNNSVMALAGRTIFMGYDGWLWSHGIDYAERTVLVEHLFEDTRQFPELARENLIDYLVISPHVRYRYDVDEQYFRNTYPLVTEKGHRLVFAVSDRAREAMQEPSVNGE